MTDVEEAFKGKHGMTADQFADIAAPIASKFIQECRASGLTPDLTALAAANVAEAIIRACEDVELTAALAMRFIAMNIELGGIGEVTIVPPKEEMN